MGHVEEEQVARTRLPAVPGDEPLAKLPQGLAHFGRHRRGLVNGARLVLDPLEALGQQPATSLIG